MTCGGTGGEIMNNKLELRNNAHSTINMDSRSRVIMRADFKSKESIISHYKKYINDNKEVFPFLDTICNILRGPKNYHSDYSPHQYVLLGQPSAGKSTELRRIAKTLAQNKKGDLNENQIIHLCSLQNTSAIHKEIESKEDLWQWIMRSHESKMWSLERYSFEQFSKLHSEFNLAPILLVDTVDLLIYGEIGTDNGKKIAHLWKELVDDCREKGWTILWSCRRHEWQIMNDGGQNVELVEVHLPPLSANLVGDVYSDMKDKPNYQQAHMVALSLAFPIIVGHKLNYSEKYSMDRIELEFKKLHYQMREVDVAENIYKKAGPISWIVKEMNGKIATDILYDGVVETLIKYVSKKWQYEEEEVRDYWTDIEREFYYAAKPNSGGARIQIERNYLNDCDDKDLMRAILLKSQHFGILHENSDTLEMTHQLFAEYCVWKHLNDSDEEMKGKFPSMIFRNQIEQGDRDALEEGSKWFLPYTVFNKNLAEIGADISGDEAYTRAWIDAAKQAYANQPRDFPNRSKTIQSQDKVKTVSRASERDINDEKRQIINSLSKNNPLIINGPPGVGKTHLSYIWMDRIALGHDWVELATDKSRSIPNLTEIPKAYFMTQSQRLARQITEKVDKYYDKDPRPVEFRDWGVDEYLSELEKLVGEPRQTFRFEDFEHEWTDYSRGIQHADLKNIPKQALWNEYIHSLIDNNGKLKSEDDYLDGRLEIFKFSKHPDKMARLYWKWACQRKSSKLTLSERAGDLIKRVIGILVDGNLGEKESLNSLQPDILILDEIQDLPAPVILLMLIMHKGDTNSVMMCGDDEQTLELVQFDWGVVFSKVTTALYELSNEYKQRVDVIEKWKALELNKVQQNNTKYMHIVERSIPEIVISLQDSWNRSVASQNMRNILKIKSENGTATIEPGKISSERARYNDENKLIQGIQHFEVHDDEWFKQVSREIYDHALDVAILLPDDEQHIRYRKLLEIEDTDLELWTPRLIKGLEYSVVIAVNPWHIDKKHFNDVVSQKSIVNWERVESYISANKESDLNAVEMHMERIKLLAEQRLRHSNIMLSRGMDKLFIVSSENNKDMISTYEYDSDPEKERPDKNDSWFGKSDESKLEKIQGIERLIRRLSLIILSAEGMGDLEQVMYKSKHILKTLESKSKVSESLPFYFLSKIRPEDGLDMMSLGFESFRKKLEQPSLSENQNKTFGLPQFEALKDFEKYVNETARFCRLDEAGGIRIPILRFNEYNSNLERFVRLFSRPNSKCFDLDESQSVTKEQEYQISVISEYIVQRFFGGRRESSTRAGEWCDAAKTIDLQDFSKSLDVDKYQRFTFVKEIVEQQNNQQSPLTKMHHTEEVEREFWKEGEHHISRISTGDLEKICRNIHNQLQNSNNSLSYEGVLFVSKLVPQSLNGFDSLKIQERISTSGVGDLCNICNTVQREADKQDLTLSPIFSQIDEKTAEIIASQLVKHYATPSVRESIRKNSYGLFDLLKHFISSPSFNDFTFEKSIAMGSLLLKDLEKESKVNVLGPMEWEHPVIEHIQDHALSLIRRGRFRSLQFISTQDKKRVYEIINNKNHSEETFASSLRWRLGETERKNIILFSMKKLFLDEFENKTTILSRKDMKKLIDLEVNKLPTKQGREDSKEWRDLLVDPGFCKELVRIPYENKLDDLSPDIYFGRVAGQFVYAKKWNECLMESFEKSEDSFGGSDFKSVFALKMAEMERETDSVFDQSQEDVTLTKNLVHKYMLQNITKPEWRENVLREGINLNKSWSFGFIPWLNARQSIILYHHLEKMKTRVEDSLRLIQSQYTAAHWGVKFFNKASKKTMPKAERSFIRKYLDENIKALKVISDILPYAHKEMEKFNVREILEKLVLFFHRANPSGEPEIKLSRKWKLLANDFLRDEFPACSMILGEINIGNISEKIHETLNIFSLIYMNGKFQIALIVFLQKFATEINYIPANSPVKLKNPEEIRSYSVLKPENHDLRDLNGELTRIRNLPIPNSAQRS